MRESRASRKARMMERAEKLIEEALDWEEKTDKPNLTQIEDTALKVRQEIGQLRAQEMIGAQEAKRAVPGPAYPSCGREMRYKDLKEVNPLTWVGKVKIERGYYHCPNCKESLFPLDEQLELKDPHYSEGVLRELVWLGGQVASYAAAESVLHRVGRPWHAMEPRGH